jgi:protein TonB
MPQHLFGDVLVRPRSIGARRSSVILSLAAHGALVITLLVVPLLALDKLPIPQRAIDLVLDDRVMPTVELRRPLAKAHGPDVLRTAPSVAPTDVPNGIAPETGLEGTPASGGFSGPPQIGSIEGIQSGDLGQTETPPPPTVAVPVRLHSGIRTPQKIVHVAPVYPAAARAAHIHGLVVLEATIDVHGQVDAIRVLKSPPFLDQAAIDAVRQWRFTPTLLNGIPVPVIMTVTINFELQ